MRPESNRPTASRAACPPAMITHVDPSHALSASLADGQSDCIAEPGPSTAEEDRTALTARQERGERQQECSTTAASRLAQAAESEAAPQLQPAASRPTPPPTFCCPISMEVMADPVMVATGHTYDRRCIQKWLSSGRRTCPLNGQRLRHLELTPNIALRGIIQARLGCDPASRHPATALRTLVACASQCAGRRARSASADSLHELGFRGSRPAACE